ncbi:MAG: IclR family transcriptional regulator [Thermodesulfobacteriota bacterium]
MLKSADRTLDVFEAFARTQKPLTLSELAREIEVAPSSCFALIKTLRDRGYLYGVGERRTLYPTRRMLDQATAIAACEPHVSRMLPVMSALRDETGETVILGRREKNAVVYLHVCESRQTVRYTARAGDLKPLHSSAIGKVILASLPRDERAKLVQALPRPRVTANTLCAAAELADDVEAGLLRGYQLTRGENVADVMAVAMPIVIGGDLFGLCIAAPMHRMSSTHARHAKALKRALSRMKEAA